MSAAPRPSRPFPYTSTESGTGPRVRAEVNARVRSLLRRGGCAEEMRIPLPSPRLRTAYQKLRQRGAIDFPLLSLALAAEVAPDDTVEAISLVVSALGSHPRVVSGLDKIAVGRPLREVVEAVAQQVHKQCHPLENLIVDPDWRRAMVPVHVRRALREIAA